MRSIQLRDRTPAIVSGIDLPSQRDVRGQVVLTGPGTSVIISEIDDEEAANWDRVAAARGMGSC